ncbi:hypothetical protein SAICODRAFT_225300, partial [Saitoella complicata NRRL Y-17804]|uniref:uncharacterized protein n=1 Tax=Saitoella complicata (strain BCRC 22490 / CBS 7301 / JCM 7358 / NBRC 10748 / NRRL Y-17804) TaxID=698492 RepID=UPI000866FE24
VSACLPGFDLSRTLVSASSATSNQSTLCHRTLARVSFSSHIPRPCLIRSKINAEATLRTPALDQPAITAH